MKKLWGGRFSKGPKKEVLEFNSVENIGLDSKLVKYDILGSIAHVKMLKKAENPKTRGSRQNPCCPQRNPC